MRTSRLQVLLAASTLVHGCEDPVGPRPAPITRVSPDWVTGAAVTAVDPVTGLFVLSPALEAELNIADARALALGYLRSFANEGAIGNTRQFAEHDRGAPIDWDDLQLCGRTFRAVSAIGPHPSFVPRRYDRLRAAQWAVSFCSRGAVELSVGVSDAPQSIDLVDGRLAWDHIDSLAGVFSIAGVPARFPSGIPLPPEDAVAFFFGLTQTRITEAPVPFDQLSTTGIGQLPLCASWRLVLERPVSVVPVGGGPPEFVSEIYVRHEPACFASSIALYASDIPAPTSIWMRYITGPVQAPTIDSVLVDALGPTRFHRVQVATKYQTK